MTDMTRYVPCDEFEERIHAFVDGETSEPDARTLLIHLELCPPCREALEVVRQSVRLHREADWAEEVTAAFDAAGFFGDLVDRLVEDNLKRLADLFYQLGKAYFIAGNDSFLKLYLHKKAISLEKARAESRRLERETEQLVKRKDSLAKRDRRSLRALERARRLLRRRPVRRGRGFGRLALVEARRFLRECLAIDPSHHAAHIAYAMVLVRAERLDDAAEQYRRLLRRDDLQGAHRVLAWQHLGNLHGMRRHYDEAVRCYEAALEAGLPADDDRFFHIWLGLAMFRAKKGDFDGSEAAFERLVRDFPQKLTDAKSFLDQAPLFQSLLETRRSFGHRLRRRYPMLFAG